MSGTLRLRGATSGYSELQAPAVAADQTFVLPTAGGTLLTTDSPVPKLTLELGSASQPSLTFEGDTDTGLYSSGTNTLNLVTGGSDRLVIDSSGRLGVGTSSPSVNLDVQATASAIASVSSTTANNYAQLRLQTDQQFVIGYGSTHSSQPNELSLKNNVGDLTFYTNVQERVRINSSGNVGIGTTSPDGLLHVKGSNPNVYIETANANEQSDIIFQSHVGGDQGSVSYSLLDNSLRFATNGTSNERMRIDSSGNVGIGTTSPDRSLHINSGIIDAVAKFESSDTSAIINFVDSGDANGVSVGSVNGNMTFRSGLSTERMRIDSSGRLLVGTSTDLSNGSADALLQLASSASPELKLVRSDTSTSTSELCGRITFSSTDGGSHQNIAQIAAQADGAQNVDDHPGRLAFSTTADGAASPTERMRIDSSGNVGIGTTVPSQLLSVDGGVGIGNQLSTGTTGAIKLVSSGGVNYIQSGQNTSNSSAAPLIFTDYNAYNEWARIDSSGNVGIGTTSPGKALSVKGSSYGQAEIVGPTGAELYFVSAEGGSSNGTIAYNHASNYMNFYTAGTERMRIDSSGRLLVGASSGGFGYSRLVVQGNTNASDGDISISYNGLNPANGNNVGIIRYTDTNGNIGATIAAQADGTWSSGSNNRTRLVFSTTGSPATSPTERMRIDNTGRILTANAVGKTFATSTSQFVGSPDGSASANTGNVSMESNTTSTSTRHHISFVNPNGVVGSISTNASATAYNTSSDYRLKENVVPLTGAADRLSQLQVHRFNFIADPDTTVDGFLAHEAQTVVPESVTGTKDEVDADGNPVYQGIDQSKIVPLVVAALQEALAEIETLKTRLADAGIS